MRFAITQTEPRPFQEVVLSVVLSASSSSLFPLFPSEQPLRMILIFRMKRPNYHFRGNQRGPGRLKNQYAATGDKVLSPTSRTDIDNLAKFVLDSLNGILYDDDKQIHSLQLIKILDTTDDNDDNDNDEGCCAGSTEIVCWSLTESDIPDLISIP